VIRYERPTNWIAYDAAAISGSLADAKATVLSLQTIPYQRSWVDALQRLQLKMEIAGTSRIEGAEFTERELETALKETPGEMVTRSQRQARAALETYEWIRRIPVDRPVTSDLICEVHRRIVTGADDDRCPPGALRERDQNVNFGTPRHRGCEGGEACRAALLDFTEALRTVYSGHDPLVQAMAAHYHLAAMHPFLDGNGRTARAVEALLLQRAGLRDTCFIAMSNYYHEEKTSYLTALAAVRSRGYDLTPFLEFGLKGVATQGRRLLGAIQHEMKKALFWNLAADLFHRLETPKKRVIAERRLAILQVLLSSDRPLTPKELMDRLADHYQPLKNRGKALVRDLEGLFYLGALHPAADHVRVGVSLDWPQQITETAFFEKLKSMPQAKR
jgi:cell filamentation protein, protein adenylyltransferase